MSCRNTLYTSEANVNRYLSRELGSVEEFSESELFLLSEYQSIKSDPNYIFLLVCAREAESELKLQYSNAFLTEYGVVIKSFLQTEYDRGEDERAVAQKKYVDGLVNANKEFLHLWEEIRKRKDRQRQKINELTVETRALIDDGTGLLYSMRLVAEEMLKGNFALTNPDVLNTPPSVALTQGVHMIAENIDGVRREVWLYLAGSRVKTEVHVPAHYQGPRACFDLAQEFARDIAEVLEKASESCGAPVIFDLGNTEPAGPVGPGRKDEPVCGFPLGAGADSNLIKT